MATNVQPKDSKTKTTTDKEHDRLPFSVRIRCFIYWFALTTFVSALLGVVIYLCLAPKTVLLPIWDGPENLPRHLVPLSYNIHLSVNLLFNSQSRSFVGGIFITRLLCRNRTKMINFYAAGLDVLPAIITIYDVTIDQSSNRTKIDEKYRLIDPKTNMWALVLDQYLEVNHEYELIVDNFGFDLEENDEKLKERGVILYKYETHLNELRIGALIPFSRYVVPGWHESGFEAPVNFTLTRSITLRSVFPTKRRTLDNLPYQYRKDVYQPTPAVSLAQLAVLLTELPKVAPDQLREIFARPTGTLQQLNYRIRVSTCGLELEYVAVLPGTFDARTYCGLTVVNETMY